MGLKMNFKAEAFRKSMSQVEERLERAIIMRLFKLGQMCVDHAVLHGSYENQTANLRNSIGFVVIARGEIVRSLFEQNETGKTPGDPQSARDNAERIAEELAKKYTRGFALIVVAGMEYAYYVETMGKDVLTTAEELAKTQLPIMMNQLKLNIAA